MNYLRYFKFSFINRIIVTNYDLMRTGTFLAKFRFCYEIRDINIVLVFLQLLLMLRGEDRSVLNHNH